jgi:hypothetical protein
LLYFPSPPSPFPFLLHSFCSSLLPLFFPSNELEAKFKGGIHLGKASANGLKGDLTGKITDFFVKTTAVATPVYPHLFLMNKLQVRIFIFSSHPYI